MLKEGYNGRKTPISKRRLSPDQETNIDMRNKITSISTIVTVLFFLSVGNIFAELERTEIGVGGLSCPFCAWGLEKKLKEIKSIEKVNIHLKQAKAEIFLKPNSLLNIAALKKAVKEAGFSTAYIYVIAKGNLIEREGQILFHIQEMNREFLLFDTEAISKDKLKEIIKSNLPVRIKGRIHEHIASNPAIGIETIAVVK